MSAAPPPGTFPTRPIAPAINGGIPSKSVDIPISAVLMAIFFPLAITNILILRNNLAKKQKFMFQILVIGLCMARTMTWAMRIAWANNVQNRNVSIAAQIFVAAGVILVYLFNVIMAKRLANSKFPSFGKNQVVSAVFLGYYLSLVVFLGLVIAATVKSLSGKKLIQAEKNARKVAPVYFTVYAFIPIIISTLALIMPSREPSTPLGRDGSSFRTKVFLICAVAVPLTLGSAVRAAGALLPPRLATNPAWYHSKGALYVFGPLCELSAVVLIVGFRFDRKFYTPSQEEIEFREEKMGKEGLDGSV